jgi:hypothetical protein
MSSFRPARKKLGCFKFMMILIIPSDRNTSSPQWLGNVFALGKSSRFPEDTVYQIDRIS